MKWWRRPVWMTRQSWTSIAASIGFLCCVVILAFVPVPYVVWAPGTTADTLGKDADGKPLVDVVGVETFPTSGRLDLTTVSVTRVDSRVGLVEAVLAWFRPGYDALDRDLYYPPGTTQQQNSEELAEMMSTSQVAATVAAVRAAGLPVTEAPVVGSVVVDGPAHKDLQPGDVVLAVGGVEVRTTDEVDAALADTLRDEPDQVVWRIRRGADDLEVTTGTRDGTTPYDRAGVQVVDGYDTGVQTRYGISDDIGGPSAGLVFSLAIYDRITLGELVAGRHVAGTGIIDETGAVGPIGGIQSKVAGAEATGATIFLVPAANCTDVAGMSTNLLLVRVGTLSDAITALRALPPAGSSSTPTPEVRTC